MKKVLGLDLDGVVYPWQRVTHEYLVMSHKIPKMSYDTFWKKIVSKEIEFSEMFWDNLVRVETLYDLYSLTEEEKESLLSLSKKYHIVYITNRSKDVEYVTRKWLRKSEVPNYTEVYFENGSKRDRVRGLFCDYFVEDRVANIQDLKGLTLPILHRQPYNEQLWGIYPEIDSITELPILLEELENEFQRIPRLS